MNPHEITAIINPVSANGKTGTIAGNVVDTLMRHFGSSLTVRMTSRRNEAADIAREAARNGNEAVIAVGGDGTINEIVNGLLSSRNHGSFQCALGIISSGTGRGLAQSLGLPPTVDEQARVILSGNTGVIEVGKVRWTENDSGQRLRYFVNECQAGIGGHVVKSIEDSGRKRNGFMGFGLTTLKLALTLKNFDIRVSIDGDGRYDMPMFGVVVANGTHTGGGMNLTPNAKFDDGKLDVLMICTRSVISRLANLPKIYSANHLKSSRFIYLKAQSVRIDSSEPVLLEADGEMLGTLPAEISVVPNALRVYIPTNGGRHD